MNSFETDLIKQVKLDYLNYEVQNCINKVDQYDQDRSFICHQTLQLYKILSLFELQQFKQANLCFRKMTKEKEKVKGNKVDAIDVITLVLYQIQIFYIDVAQAEMINQNLLKISEAYREQNDNHESYELGVYLLGKGAYWFIKTNREEGNLFNILSVKANCSQIQFFVIKKGVITQNIFSQTTTHILYKSPQLASTAYILLGMELQPLYLSLLLHQLCYYLFLYDLSLLIVYQLLCQYQSITNKFQIILISGNESLLQTIEDLEKGYQLLDDYKQDIMNFLAWVYFNKEKIDEAQTWGQLLKNLNPRFPGIANNLAIILNQKGQYEKVKKLYQEAEQNFPNNHVVLHNLANYYGDIGNLQKEKEYYQRSYYIMPRSAYSCQIFNIEIIKQKKPQKYQMKGLESIQKLQKIMIHLLKLQYRITILTRQQKI